MNTLQRKNIKTNIDKYVFLFSAHAKTRTVNNNVVEYSWNIEPVSINERGTIELCQKTFLPYMTTPTITTTPYIIRRLNLSSPSIVHSDNGGNADDVNKGTILDMSYPFQDISNPIRLFLDQQTIHNYV